MARRLVEDMSADWKPEDYKDEFEAKIMALVEKKAHEGKIEDVETVGGEEERKTADVIDLTELLKRSLGGKTTAKPKENQRSRPRRPRRKRPRRLLDHLRQRSGLLRGQARSHRFWRCE